MPGPGRKFLPGNTYGRWRGPTKGRPKLEVASLADAAAVLVLTQDLETISKPARTNEQRRLQHLARERISRMVKGRIPTRLAIAGDEGDQRPIPFRYVTVVDAPAREDEEVEGVGPEA